MTGGSLRTGAPRLTVVPALSTRIRFRVYGSAATHGVTTVATIICAWVKTPLAEVAVLILTRSADSSIYYSLVVTCNTIIGAVLHQSLCKPERIERTYRPDCTNITVCQWSPPLVVPVVYCYRFSSGHV